MLDITPTMRRIGLGRVTRSYFAPASKRRKNLIRILDGRLASTLHSMGMMASPEQVTQLQQLLLDTFRLGFDAGIRNQQ